MEFPLLSDSVINELKQCDNVDMFKRYVKEHRGMLADAYVPSCKKAIMHKLKDYFYVYAASDKCIEAVVFTVCKLCHRVNLNNVAKVRLTYTDTWYHSIRCQEEPPKLTKYAKKVLKRAILKNDEYSEYIDKAMGCDMRYDYTNRPSLFHEWYKRVEQKRLLAWA